LVINRQRAEVAERARLEQLAREEEESIRLREEAERSEKARQAEEEMKEQALLLQRKAEQEAKREAKEEKERREREVALQVQRKEQKAREEKERFDRLYAKHRHGFVELDGQSWRMPSTFGTLLSKASTYRSLLVIPSVTIGSYGCPVNFRVVQVVDDWNMLVTDIQTQRGEEAAVLRISGYDSRSFADGMRYSTTDMDIAIIGRWKYRTALGSDRLAFVAVPTKQILAGLSYSQFRRLTQQEPGLQ
jgi:hypothetical protein